MYKLLRQLLNAIAISLVIVAVYTNVQFTIIPKPVQTDYNLFKGIYELNCTKRIRHNHKFAIVMLPSLTRFQKPEQSGLDWVGVCMSYPNGDRLIGFKKSFWDKSDEDTRTTLVFHELSHCIMGVNHSPDSDNYMNEYLPIGLRKLDLYNQLVKNVKSTCR